MKGDLVFWLFCLWFLSILIWGWMLTVRIKWIRTWIGGFSIVCSFLLGFCIFGFISSISETFRKNDSITTFYDFLITITGMFFVFGSMFFMGFLLQKSGKIHNVPEKDLQKREKGKKVRFSFGIFKFLRLLFNLPYSNVQKYFIGLALVSVVSLLLALPDHWIDAGGYFVFLRIVCFASLIGLLLEKLPVWLKFPLLLLAILYNPVFQIHLRDRDVWRFFNVISIFFLLIPWCFVMKRLYVKSKNSLQNDSQTGVQNGTPETR